MRVSGRRVRWLWVASAGKMSVSGRRVKIAVDYKCIGGTRVSG